MEKVIIGDCVLYRGDCLEIMPTLGKVDAVVTDPPYGIAYVSSWRKQGKTRMLQNDDSAPLESVPLMAELLKDGGALYLASRHDVEGIWRDAIIASGLILKTPIYWDKMNHTSGDLEGDFGARIEIIIFAHKGRHKLRGARLANLWQIPRESHSEHPTPKPVALMQRILSVSTDTLQSVIDPFMGSGTTGVACARMGRKFIGVEIDPKYFDLACKRIEETYKQSDLFIQDNKPVYQQESLL